VEDVHGVSGIQVERETIPFPMLRALFFVQEILSYVNFSVSRKLDTHDLRSDFHGFPSLGWHREQGVHLAHELITNIVRVVVIPESIGLA
jgi:hypothetical protein